MDSDNDCYHSENEFYYPDEENVLQENKNKLKRAAVKIQHKNCLQTTLQKKKINTLFAGQGRSVLAKTVSSVLSTAVGRTQDLWHSFSQCGPPGRQITYINSPFHNEFTEFPTGAFIAILLFKHSLFDRKFQLENVTSEKDQRLADKDEEIAAKQEELKQKEQEIQALENEISESNEYLAEIESTVDEVSLGSSSILGCLCLGTA